MALSQKITKAERRWGFTPDTKHGVMSRVFSRIYLLSRVFPFFKTFLRMSRRHKNTTPRLVWGFTVVELLVVMSIIGILATIVIPSVNKARAKSRDAVRRADLVSLQTALEIYWNVNGAYPSTINSGWYSSEPGNAVTNNSGNYIPGLSPSYIFALPRDPRGGASKIIPPCSSWKAAYLYKSDGTNFKLLSHCAPESFPTAGQAFYDPMRPTHAWMVCSSEPACSSW